MTAQLICQVDKATQKKGKKKKTNPKNPEETKNPSELCTGLAMSFAGNKVVER